jgi:hypothetical protein
VVLPLVIAGALVSAAAGADDPQDARLKPMRTLNDPDHPWAPPTTREAWDAESQRIREQLLVACGLWPMPEKSPLAPVVHGKIERDGYSVEKVYFASRPGHYVTGSLYRPANLQGTAPGVLCPHGHWANGRFYDAGDAAAEEQITIGAEEFPSGARSPLQARMVQLARMGCVVFHYDMVGIADNQPIDHRGGFNDVQAELWLQNKLGLQTWNSIRALDFLTSLPDVDASRIGVTGASGGGTQTFMLCAIDPRPTVAFPAVMVSTAMQGGCTCENASYLRHDINNIAIAALFAPRPMALSGADDWTIDIETKGLPELKQVYSLFDSADKVNAVCYPQFQHNYNQVAREMMFDWFNEHLGLGLDSPVKQTDFEPLTRDELTVYTEEHPVPQDSMTSEDLRALMTKETEAWFASIVPDSADQVAEYRRIVGTAARVMLDSGVPETVEAKVTSERRAGDQRMLEGHLGRPGSGEVVRFVVLLPNSFRGDTIIWVDGSGRSHLLDGTGAPTAPAKQLLDTGYAVVSADLFLTGPGAAEALASRKVDDGFPGYTFGYNRPLVSERVHDILTLVRAATLHQEVQRVHLVATGEAGPWGLLAAALARDRLASTTADLRGFSFAQVSESADPMLLPGALRYGDIGGLAALAAPAPLTVYGAKDVDLAALKSVYATAGGDLQLDESALTPEIVAERFEQ